MDMNSFLEALAQFFRYFLPVVGVIALVYLILFLKKLIETLKEVDKTLVLLDDQVKKLDAPLETVENLSKTIDDANTKVREVAINTSKTLNENKDKLKTWVNDKKEDGSIKENAEQVKSWVNEKKDFIKDGVSTLSDSISENIKNKKENLREYPVYHSQEEQDHE